MNALASWNDTETTQAIVGFAETAAQTVPPEERVAVFDNDGTLWCEKPMPIELEFILRRLAEMAEQDFSLRERQPWKAAYEKDYAWLGDVLTKHYAGDDSDVRVLMGGILQAFANWSVDDYGSAAGSFVRLEKHPTLGRTFHRLGYLPRSSSSAIWRPTGSPATSPRGATGTSCARSGTRSTAFRPNA